jgi:hypothetical protein
MRVLFFGGLPKQRRIADATLPTAAGSLIAAVCAMLAVSGCASILGIEEATCAPEIDPNCAPNEGADTDNDDTDDDDGTDDDGQDDDNVGTDDSTDDGQDDDDADDSDGTPTPTEPPETLEEACAVYCSQIEENCNEDALRQYVDEETCVQLCNVYFNFGEDQDAALNSTQLECRLISSANAGKVEPEVECLAAGLTGEGCVESTCDVYCEVMSLQCPNQFESDLGGNFDACLEVCNAVPDTDEPFNVSIQSGNTKECRFYHIQAAGLSPRVHCPHAAGASPCSD